MDSFIFYGDYQKQIQTDNLQQVIGQKQSILDGLQLAAVEECKSYLKQKYDVSKAFNPITKHDKTKPYKAGDVVYLDAPVYSPTATYAVGVLCLQAENIYSCSTAITVGEVFTPSHWTLIAPQYTIYSALLPYPEFGYKQIYSKGDIVFWNDKTYTALLPTQMLGHETLLQVNKAGTSEILNVFPDDALGAQYWGAGESYSILEDTPITNSAWSQGDNRDQKLLQICINIVLYWAHVRISPKNVPDQRVINYIGHGEDRETRGQRVLYPTYSALGWLQAASIGNDITPSLPLLQPNSGARIRFGGNFKNINSY